MLEGGVIMALSLNSWLKGSLYTHLHLHLLCGIHKTERLNMPFWSRLLAECFSQLWANVSVLGMCRWSGYIQIAGGLALLGAFSICNIFICYWVLWGVTSSQTRNICGPGWITGQGSYFKKIIFFQFTGPKDFLSPYELLNSVMNSFCCMHFQMSLSLPWEILNQPLFWPTGCHCHW